MKGLRKLPIRPALMVTTALGFAIAMPEAAFAQSDANATQANGTGENAAPAPQSASRGNEDIVVTARHSSERAQNVPISITTVTAQTMRDLNVRDVYDIQRVTPGLYISSTQLGGKVRLYIRGQSEQDDRLTGDRSVGIFIDGAPFEHDYGVRSSLVDLAQVEVLRGPQGTLFGKNTTGGTLNVTTQHPTYVAGGYVDLTYGSYNNFQGLAVLNVPLVDNALAVRLVGQINSREGFYREFDGHRSNDDHSAYGRMLVRADPTSNLHILLSGDYVRLRNTDVHTVLTAETLFTTQNTATGQLGAIAAQLGLNPALAADRLTAYNRYRTYYDAVQLNPRLGFDNTRDPHDDLDHWGLSANVALDIGSVTARSITAYRHLTRSTALDFDSVPFDLLDPRQSVRDHNFSQEVQLSAIDGTGLDWQIGGYYNHEVGDDYAASDSNVYVNPTRTVITDSGIVSSSKAAYGQAVYHFTPTLRATAGIRYTDDSRTIISHNRLDTANALLPLPAGSPPSRCNLLSPALGGPTFPNCSYSASTSSSKVTWLLSADWRPIPEIMFFGSVSTGYRAGAFSAPGNTAAITTVAANVAAFTPYLPETLTNYEAGFKSDLLGRRLRVNASFYYQDYRDVQVRIRDIVNGVLIQTVRNAGRAHLYGGELEVTATPVDGLTLSGTAAYFHGRYTDYTGLDSAGNVLDLTATPFTAPKWTYGLAAAYTLPVRNGSVRFNMSYAWTGNINFSPTVFVNVPSLSQSSYGLLDARINWHIDSANLDIAVFGKNLTDRIYRVNAASAGSYNFANIGDPRTFGVQVRKTF